MRFTIFYQEKVRLLPRKEKSIALKPTKGNDSSKDVHKAIISDESSSIDEEEMDFIVKRSTRFFQSKRNHSSRARRDSSSKRDSRIVKKEEKS